MKQQFYILIECEPGRTYEVGQQILDTEMGKMGETHSISGEWDLLIRVEFDAGKNFGAAVSKLVGSIQGIVRTHTIIGYSIWDPEDVFFEEDFE